MPVTEKPDKKSPLSGRWLSVVLCLGFLIGGGLVFMGLAGLKEKPAQLPVEEKIYKVDVFEVQQLPLKEIIAGFGTSRAYREVVLSAEVGGVIVEKHPQLKAGAHVDAASVKVDDQGRTLPATPTLPLVRIDPETYHQRIAQAEARIAEVEAELKVLVEQEANNERLLKKALGDVEVYQREFRRIEDLGKRGVTSKTETTTARLELERYKQAVLNMENERRLFPVRKLQLERKRDTLESELATAQLDLKRTEVRPPFDGVLGEVMVELGQNLRPGDALVRILDLDVIEVPISLPLGDYDKIAALMQAGIQPVVKLARNTTSPPQWTGHIERVAPQADESTRTVEVFVRVENSQQQLPLLPGTFVHARIDGPVIDNAIAVPRDCIVAGRVFVAQAVENESEPSSSDQMTTGYRAVKRPVNLNRTMQSFALIGNDLKPGERIIMTNLDILSENSQIEIQNQKQLADELKLLQAPLIVPGLADRVDSDDAGDSG